MPFYQDTIRKKKLIAFSRCAFLKFYFSVLFAFVFTVSFSQNEKPDSALASPLQAMYKQYVQGAAGSLALYSGAEYEGAYPRVAGSPFWNSNDFQKGVVSYGGVIYYEVPMAYDLVRNEIIIKGFQGLSLRLEKEKVEAFAMAGHTFVHLNDSSGKNGLPDDFYDLLYSGDVQVYAKRSKRIAQSFHAEGLDTLVSNTLYFLHKDNAYSSINNANDLLRLLGNDKSAMKAFEKGAGLNFKKDPDGFITQTLEHWEGTKK